MINEHHSGKYTSGKPEVLGDRYYGQDLLRDFWYLLDKVGQLGLDSGGFTSFIYGETAGTVTHGVSDSLNITACVGYQATSITVPDSYAALPPTTKSETATVRIALPTQTNTAVTGGQIDVNHYANATLDGSTVNYVKIKYIEEDGQSRTRARASGSYVYEKIPSYELRIEPIAATSSEIALASFTGTSGGAFTITQSSVDRIALYSEISNNIINALNSHGFVILTGSGTWTCPNNVTQVIYGMIGGGGGGGGGNAAVNGGGGGAGGSSEFGIKSVTAGNGYNYTCGAGGSGGAANANGTSGGNTTIFSITANGGEHGSTNSAGTGGGSNTGYSGASGTYTGALNGGTGGGAAGALGGVQSGIRSGGLLSGVGGNGGTDLGGGPVQPTNGSNYGAGGGGGSGQNFTVAQAGANGSDGVIILMF